MKKDIEWLREQIKNEMNGWSGGNPDYFRGAEDAYEDVKDWLNQLDELEVLSQKWIDDNKEMYLINAVPAYKLQNLLVPKQEEVDQAYKDGYEKGKQHTFYKGYLEGITDKGSEPETVADVVTAFWESYERLKEVMNMEVEELEA